MDVPNYIFFSEYKPYYYSSGVHSQRADLQESV